MGNVDEQSKIIASQLQQGSCSDSEERVALAVGCIHPESALIKLMTGFN